MRLTRRQQQILDVLRERAGQFEHPPTLDELCAMLGLRSRGSLHKHVQALIQAGFVAPMAGQHRGICLIADDPTDDGIPFLGKIAAGRPIEALPQPEQMQVPPYLRTDKPCYVLQVVGDSMREAGIPDGDYVVQECRVSLVNPSGGSCRRTDSLLGDSLCCPGTPRSGSGFATSSLRRSCSGSATPFANNGMVRSASPNPSVAGTLTG